jgi:hypothetical protein
VRRAGLAFKRGCSVDTQNADGRRGVRGSGHSVNDMCRSRHRSHAGNMRTSSRLLHGFRLVNKSFRRMVFSVLGLLGANLKIEMLAQCGEQHLGQPGLSGRDGNNNAAFGFHDGDGYSSIVTGTGKMFDTSTSKDRFLTFTLKVSVIAGILYQISTRTTRMLASSMLVARCCENFIVIDAAHRWRR